MIRIVRVLALIVPLGVAPATAGPKDTGEPEDMDIEGVAGKRLPEIDGVQGAAASKQAEDALVKRGAKALGLPEDYVRRTRVGFAKVFERDYKGARQHFVKLDQDHPGTGISGSVDALVWQALMLENFDFRYDRQYEVANKKALDDLKVALQSPEHQGWEHFQMAGLMGVEAIHMVRHGTYLPALNRAFEAMDHVQSAREAAPDFTDLDIADGMYNYWRTVVTMSTKFLPDFGDNRALGIRQIQNVQDNGIFLSDPATLALAFTWLEERKYDQAVGACRRNEARYPNNVINNLLLGQALLYQRHYDDSIAVFKKIQAVAPENNRVHYYLGLATLRKGQPKEAIQHLERYLASDHLEGWQKASGHYRLGQAHYRLKAYKSAEYHYKLAVKETGHKASKQAIDRMQDLRKQGRISY